jgi:hypothetical protein
MLCAGALGAQFIAGKAARDAIYLANLDVTSLPLMVIITSFFSIALVTVHSRTLRAVDPATFVPWSFIASALLLVVEWALTVPAPRIAAPLIYLHISGIGPLLSSEFWLIASERFDPHTAKQRFGQIAGAGTIGGLLGGVIAERVGATFGTSTILLGLAALNAFCAWEVRAVAGPNESAQLRVSALQERAAETARSGFATLASAPYLRHLAAVVFLGTLGAGVLDYLFKAAAVTNFGRSDQLLRFFSFYYTGVGLLTFGLQTTSSRWALEKFGLGIVASTPAMALVAGSLGAAAIPGLGSVVAARGGESALHGSLYRSAYELFYTPMSAVEKRAAKSVIDVGFDRLGDAVGGVALRLLLLLAPAQRLPVGLAFTIGCAIATMMIAWRLNQGYTQTLERQLVRRAVDIDLGVATDYTTRAVLLRTVGLRTTGAVPQLAAPDPVLADIADLTSKDKVRILRVLSRNESPPPPLVMHIVPLLGRDSIAEAAARALRRVAEWHVGLLTDALLDPARPFAVRRRVARVLATCSSQRAVDGLLFGLQDLRFEVRVNCARSLAAIHERNPLLTIPTLVVLDAVRRELGVGSHRWHSQHIEDRFEFIGLPTESPIPAAASPSLTHVFTLLSLVFSTEALRAALGALHADAHLRGTALEYLEAVLPRDLWDHLRPFLEGERGAPAI